MLDRTRAALLAFVFSGSLRPGGGHVLPVVCDRDTSEKACA